MTIHPIISQGEALQILKNDLRKAALQQHAAELDQATPERKAEILARIDRDIQKELQKRPRRIFPDILLH